MGGIVLFIFRFTHLLEMMFPLFLPILLGLPWVDTTINNTSEFDNSTSGLDNAIEPRARCKYDPKTPNMPDGKENPITGD